MKEILDGRKRTIPVRIHYGVATFQQAALAQQLFNNLEIWIIATSEDEKEKIQTALSTTPMGYSIKIFSLKDVKLDLDKLQNA